jgi:hypothetical protein
LGVDGDGWSNGESAVGGKNQLELIQPTEASLGRSGAF